VIVQLIVQVLRAGTEHRFTCAEVVSGAEKVQGSFRAGSVQQVQVQMFSRGLEVVKHLQNCRCRSAEVQRSTFGIAEVLRRC